MPAILILGKNRSLTKEILETLKKELSSQLGCTILEVTKVKELETVMALMDQRINQLDHHSYINDIRVIIIEDVEGLGNTANGLIFLDYLFERARVAKLIIVIRSTSTHLSSLITDLADKCNVRLIAQMQNTTDLELLAQPDTECGLPSDKDRSFLIRQEGMPPKLSKLEEYNRKDEIVSESN
ncbi:hypothetical protein LMB49_03850 [Limosilactobacillus reuteri]|nr:hypothetical protein [Limosilactobacillus reuteri]